jgi:AraC-like DNA-binding protein
MNTRYLPLDSTLLTDVSVGEIIYPPGGTYGPRVQKNVQLVVLHTGEMDVAIDGEMRHAEPNTVTLLMPGHREHFTFARKSQTLHSWLHMTFEPLLPDLEAALGTLTPTLPLSPQINSMMRIMLQLQMAQAPKQVLGSLGKALLYQYIHEAEQGALHSHPSALQQARQYIHEHLHEPLDVNRIAHHAAVSKSQLTRIFRQQLNTTPMSYLWSQRVARGIELLHATGLSVGEIAVRCGFENANHFSRRVKEATNYSPRLLRQRMWLIDDLRDH